MKVSCDGCGREVFVKIIDHKLHYCYQCSRLGAIVSITDEKHRPIDKRFGDQT